jgi:hypothetical protein
VIERFLAQHDAAFCTPAAGYENLATNLAELIGNLKELQKLVERYEQDRLEAWEQYRER